MSLLYILLLFFLCTRGTESQDVIVDSCDKGTNTTISSQVSKNIDELLAKMVSKASFTGFSAGSYGRHQDKVYGLAQCRGDVSSKECSNCIQDAAKHIRQSCTNQADAQIWYDYCFLRHDRKNFIGKVDTSSDVYLYNVDNVSDPVTFNRKLGALMADIRAQALVHKNKGHGKGETKQSPLLTLYGLVQCTRDLSKLSCARCLTIAVGKFPNFCHNSVGCRVLYSSCYVRYELYPFFFPEKTQDTRSDTSKVVVHP